MRTLPVKQFCTHLRQAGVPAWLFKHRWKFICAWWLLLAGVILHDYIEMRADIARIEHHDYGVGHGKR